jgi:hypothetical protein
VGAAIAGAAAGGAGGGVFCVLVGAGIREDEAAVYQHELGRDRILLRVTGRGHGMADRVRSIFEATGGRVIAPLTFKPSNAHLH